MKHARWKSWLRLKPEASGINLRKRRAAFVVLSQNYPFSVGLFPTQRAEPGPATRYAITIAIGQNAGSAALGIAVAAFSISGQPSSNYTGFLQISNSDGTTPTLNGPAPPS